MTVAASGKPALRTALARSPLLVFFAALLLLTGCSKTTASVTDSGHAHVWSKVGSVSLPANRVADGIGPVPLHTGHIRIRVMVSGPIPAKTVSVVAAQQTKEASTVMPQQETWVFGRKTREVDAQLSPGDWTFSVSKMPPAVFANTIAKVTVEEER